MGLNADTQYEGQSTLGSLDHLAVSKYLKLKLTIAHQDDPIPVLVHRVRCLSPLDHGVAYLSHSMPVIGEIMYTRTRRGICYSKLYFISLHHLYKRLLRLTPFALIPVYQHKITRLTIPFSLSR